MSMHHRRQLMPRGFRLRLVTGAVSAVTVALVAMLAISLGTTDTTAATGRRDGNMLTPEQANALELTFRKDALGAGLAYLDGNGAMQFYYATPGGVIRVYFHIITDGISSPLPTTVIDSQLKVLNKAFAPTQWSFTLANFDVTVMPQWMQMSQGSSAEHQMKNLLRQGTADDLNIYITQLSGGMVGWSSMPSSYAGQPKDDGVVLDADTLPGGSWAPYNLGDTAVHEVGHWMGLYHTFQGGCAMGPTAGDFATDTAAEQSAAFGCPVTRDSCPFHPGLDPVTNYMDFTDDSCMNTFSADQDKRMDQQFWLYRFGK